MALGRNSGGFITSRICFIVGGVVASRGYSLVVLGRGNVVVIGDVNGLRRGRPIGGGRDSLGCGIGAFLAVLVRFVAIDKIPICLEGLLDTGLMSEVCLSE